MAIPSYKEYAKLRDEELYKEDDLDWIALREINQQIKMKY